MMRSDLVRPPAPHWATISGVVVLTFTLSSTCCASDQLYFVWDHTGIEETWCTEVTADATTKRSFRDSDEHHYILAQKREMGYIITYNYQHGISIRFKN